MEGMKRLFFLKMLMLMLTTAVWSAKTEVIVSLYKQGNYKKVCKQGMREYYRGNKEAHFAAMVGMACARSDAINPLGILQRSLVTTPALRSSATYFSTLILAKRLLYQHFIDGVALNAFVLPKYDHVLSIVFDHIARNDFKTIGNGMIRIEEGDRSILVSVSDDRPARLLVDEYLGAKLLHRHWYQ
jgi:hypothetical protein